MFKGPDTLLRQCQKCGMQFENYEHLAIHQKRFCTDGDYGTISRLENRMKEHNNARGEPPRNNLTANIPTLHTKDEDFKRAYNNDIQNREIIMQNELNRIKQEKGMFRSKKQEQEEALADLLKDVELKNERDLRARIEKDQIKKDLVELERNKLTTLEQEKKNQLERLANDRENLRQKEIHLLNDISRLENDMKAMDNVRDTDMKKLQDSVDKLHRRGNENTKVQDFLLQERSDKIAELKLRRENLEYERIRIMDEKEKVKNGDLYSSPKRPNYSLYAANQMLNTMDQLKNSGIDDARTKIQQMKTDHGNAVRSNHIYPEYLNASPATNPLLHNSFSTKNVNNHNFNQQTNPFVGPNQEQQQLGNSLGFMRKSYTSPNNLNSPFANNANNILSSPMRPPTTVNPLSQSMALMPSGMNQVQNVNDVMHLRDRYLSGGGADPTVLRNFENMEGFFRNASARGPAPNEFYEPEKLNAQFQSMLDQKEAENTKLKNELEMFKVQNDKIAGISSAPGNFTLADMNLKLNGFDSQKQNPFSIYTAQKEFFIQNEARSVDLNEDERMIVGLGSQEVDALRLLSQIPIGTELYRFKMEQFKELSTTRTEMEKIMQEQRLLKMRREFEKVRREEDRKFENEKWVDDQRKNIIANRLRKDLNPSKKTRVYDPTEGFIISWDYLLSVPKKNDSCQIVYGIYINGDEVHPPSMIEPKACEVDTSVTNRCIFGENHPVSEIPANANALLIFEVQLFPSKDSTNPRLTSFGWSQLDLFDARRELKRGKFKVPLYECPTDTNQDIDGIRFLTPVQNGVSWLYLRISFPNEEDYAKPYSIYPENTHMEYNIPQIHLRNFRPQMDGQFANNQSVRYPPYEPLSQSRRLTPSIDYNRNNNFMNQLPPQQPPMFEPQQPIEQPPPMQIPQPQQNQPPELEDIQEEPEESIRMPTPPPQNQTVLDPNEKKALQIVIHGVKNHQARSHLKISCALYEEDQIVIDDMGQKCVFNTTVHNPLDTAKKDQSMLNATSTKISNKAHGQDIIFKEDHIFFKDINRMIQKNQGRKDYYLMFQILEKPEPTKIQTDSQTISYKMSDTANYGGMEYDLFGWFLFKLNKAEGGVNIGKFVRKMFAPGLRKPPLDMTKVKTKESDIEFAVNEVEWDGDDHPGDKSRVGRSKKHKSKKHHKSSRSKSGGKSSSKLNTTVNKTMMSSAPDVELDNRPFIENLKQQYIDRNFESGMGVDLYIDGCRFLPDNVTVTKITVQIVNVDFDIIKAAETNLPDLDSPTYNPLYNFRIEIRPQRLSPTALAFISIDTIDKGSNTSKIVGYSGINLFINRFTKKQAENNDTDVVLLSGNYQLPIYCQEPFRTKPFNMEKIESLERLPTASILVRIRQAPLSDDGLRVLNLKDVPKKDWERKGIYVPRPVYAVKAYNTSFYQVKDSEKELFSIRQGKDDPPLRETAQLLLNAEGINREMEDEEMIAYLNDKIQRNSATGLIDLLYFAKYRPESGFKFALDGLHNAPTAQPYVGLFQLNPPGDFYVYDDEPNVSKLQLNSVLDWEGPLLSPRFLDGYMTFKDIPFSKNSHLVVDIRTVNLLKHPPQFTHVGWTIVPLFTADGFVWSGVYQVPLITGEVNKRIIEEIAENDPWPYILDQIKAKKIKWLGQTSIMIRLVDAQREGHYEQPWDFTRVDYRYLPKKDLQKYAYNNNADAKARQGKILKTIVPNKGNTQTYQKRITDAFINELGLTQYQNE